MFDDYEENLDEWLMDSIARYKQLSMYDSEYRINHLERTDAEHLCIVGKKKEDEANEIIEVQLPRKHLVDESQEGLEKDKDLKIERGGYATSDIFQMVVVENQRKLLTSEEGKCGISMYDLGPHSNSSISNSESYHCKYLRPLFSFNGEHVLLTAPNNQHVSLMELSTGICTQVFDLKTSSRELVVEPGYLSYNVCVFCDKNSGVLYVRDLRCADGDGTRVMNAVLPGDNGIWTVTTLFKQTNDSKHPCDLKCACTSTGGRFLAYDIRNPQVAYCTADVQGTDAPVRDWGFSLKATNNFRRFAMKDSDGKVNVYDMDDSSNLKLVFTHDGHVYEHANKAEKCDVMSHMFVKDDMLLSADNHKSLHCWQFLSLVAKPCNT